MALKSYLAPVKTRPVPAIDRAPPLAVLSQLFGLSFSLFTCLLIGASIQSIFLLCTSERRFTVYASMVLLAIKLIDACLVAAKIKPNQYMKDVFLGRNTAVVPDQQGVIQGPGSEKIAVLLLGVKSNHPFGPFAPQFFKLAQWFMKMNAELGDSPELAPGFLGQTNWSRKDERGAMELNLVSYWRSIEDLHAYAHGPLHREAWNWWEKTIKSNNYVGINHEIFEADKGHWENVYVNFQPSGLGATTFLRKGDKLEGGEIDDAWISPLVDARRGNLAKSSTRLGWNPTKHDADRPYSDAYNAN